MISDNNLLMYHDSTPREIRALTLSALEPEKNGILWDVGSGCGSVAFEWILAGKNNRSIAIENNLDYVKLIKTNCTNLNNSYYQIGIVEGDAREILEQIYNPVAVFLGCPSDISLELIEKIYDRLGVGGRFVCNAGRDISISTINSMLNNHKNDDGDIRIIDLTIRKIKLYTRHQLVLVKR